MLFVGQQPGWNEERMGMVFVGESAFILDDAIRDARLPPETRFAYTNAARCATHKPSRDEVKHCRGWLEAELVMLRPKVVVILGDIALQSVLKTSGITKRRGEAVFRDGRAYLPTFHPAAVAYERGRPGLPSATYDTLVKDLTQVGRLLAQLAGGDDKLVRIFKRYRTVTTRRQRDWLLQKLQDLPGPFSVDTEYEYSGPDPLEWLHTEATLLTFQVSWDQRMGYTLPVDHPESPWRNDPALKATLAHLIQTKRLIVQNQDSELAIFWRALGVHPSKVDILLDTMVASLLRRGPHASHKLKHRAYTEADTGGYDEPLETWLREHPPEPNGPRGYSRIPLATLAPYGACDTDTTMQIAVKDVVQLRAEGQWEFYQKVLKRAGRLNVLMRARGILVDWDEWAVREAYWRQEKAACREAALAVPEVRAFAEAHEAATGNRFSLSSDPQMRALLFDVLGAPRTAWETDTGQASLNQLALQDLIRLSPPDHPGAALATTIQRQNYAETILSRYVEGTAKVTWEDGCLHPDWHLFTFTARRASSGPNCQNYTLGKWGDRSPQAMDNTRMLLRARPGYSLVEPDMKQIEWRIAALLSRDPVMLAGLAPGADPHQASADRFGLPRSLAKTVNFGSVFDAQGPKLAETVQKDTRGKVLWTDDYAQQTRDGFWTLYAGLREEKEKTHAFILEHGYVQTILGQRRNLPMAFSRREGDREKACREGWNFRIQPVAHALIYVALDWIQDQIEAHGFDWHILLDMHDGCPTEVPIGEEADAGRLFRHAFEEVAPRILPPGWQTIPLPCELKTGSHYGALAEYEP